MALSLQTQEMRSLLDILQIERTSEEQLNA